MENVFINPAKNEWRSILQRPAFDTKALEEKVSAILADVKLNGDDAVKKYATQFDGVQLSDLKVSLLELDEAEGMVEEGLRAAILIAKNNIENFTGTGR
jgi:histidinol dehydrogenase